MKLPKAISRALNRIGYFKNVKLSAFSSVGSVNAPASNIEDQLQAYSGWAFACVKAISEATSNMELKLFKIKNRKNGEVEELIDHELLSLLTTVNPFMTFRDLLIATQSFKELTGEAFWYLSRPEGTGAKINAILILRPDWIDVKLDTDGFVAGYDYRVPGEGSQFIPKEQMIHFKEFNPLSFHRGFGTTQAAGFPIETEKLADKYNLKFFENSAIPGALLQTDEALGDDVIKRMKTDWYNEFMGANKAHRMAILSDGMKYTNAGFSQKEMDFQEGQRNMRDKVLAMFRVPKILLGMPENANRASAFVSEFVFAKYVIKPKMQAIIDTMNEFLVPIFGEDSSELFFDFDDPVPQDVEERMKVLESGIKNSFLTPNEVRAELGYDEVEGLDVYLSPMNITQLTNDTKGVKKKTYKKKLKPQTLEKRFKEDIEHKITSSVMNLILKATSEYQGNKKMQVVKQEEIERSRIPYELQERFVNKTDKLARNYEKSFKGKLLDYFTRQEKETLKKLEQTQKAAFDVNDVLLDLSAEDKIAFEIFIPILEELVKDQGNDALTFLGLDEQVLELSDEVNNYFKTRAFNGIKKMNSTTQKQLKSELQKAIAAGESIPQISKTIQNVFTFASKTRADRIAETETLRAANVANLTAYKQSGVVQGKEWFTALDERVCQWCGPIHGKTKSLDINYFNQGEKVTGREGGVLDLSFENVDSPPLHPSCRCVLIPVVVTERMIGNLVAKLSKKETANKDEIIKEVTSIMERYVGEKIGGEVKKQIDDLVNEE